MRILYSNPLVLHQTGSGRPYGFLHDYLLKQNEHEVVYLSGQEFVRELYGSTPPPESLEMGSLSDLIISFDADLSGDVFLGCGCASLLQMETIRRNGGRTKLVTTWFSSHFEYVYKLLSEEYPKVGMNVKDPIDPFLMWRDIREHKISDALIVPSEACAETYRSHGLEGKVHVVNFGVDSTVFHPPEKPAEGFRVLFAGGNWVRKGLHYLVEAWNELRLPDGTLTIMGTNPRFSSWRTNFVEEWIPDELVPEYYRRHNVFCLPTLEEGQALANLEAMASGLAVITTKESGAPIKPEEDGIFVNAKDVQDLKDALVNVYNNPSDAQRMGQNARKKAEQMTWERFGEGIVKVLEEVAAK